jgi:medium-chain acyl-[acyl-carrier-protein] hydrolase
MSSGILERSLNCAVGSGESHTRSRNLDSAIYRPRPKTEPRCRLFCFPYAGAGAAIFRLWPSHLPEDVEVVSVHPAGRAHRLREPSLTRVEAMVEMAFESFRYLLDRPFAVFGHSLGAVVGAEFVRVASAKGMEAAHLFVSSRPPIRQEIDQLHKLADLDFISAMNDRYQGIPKEILADQDLVELLLPALRADIEALETFVHTGRATLGCPISVYGGAADPTVSLADLQAWNNEASAPCDIRLFAGDHFYINREAKALLADVSAILDQV